MPPPVLALGHPAHRNRVAVQLARYFALHLVNVEGTLAWGSDTFVFASIDERALRE